MLRAIITQRGVLANDKVDKVDIWCTRAERVTNASRTRGCPGYLNAFGVLCSEAFVFSSFLPAKLVITTVGLHLRQPLFS
jgi:hypothetical protein